MKKIDNKMFKVVTASSLLVIVVALALIWGNFTDSSPSGRCMNPGLMMRDKAEYGYATGNSAAAPTSIAMDGGMMLSDSYKTSLPYPAPSVGGQTAAEAEPRIIKTADLSIGVDGVEAKTQEIATLATGRGGFVQSSTIAEDEDGYKSGYVIIRVPSDTFEDTIQAIKDLSVRVDRESVNGQDVTEQYTDLEARLHAAQAEEEQYLEILDKAETVQDILSVQSYLQNVRYEIESLQGQIDSIGNQTDYSTISVTLNEEVRVQIPAEKFDLVRDIKMALKYVVLLAQAAVTYLVWFIIVGGAVIIPLSLLAALIVWVVRKIIARL